MTIFPRKRQRFDELSYYRLNKRGLARYRTMYNDLFVKQGRQFCILLLMVDRGGTDDCHRRQAYRYRERTVEQLHH